MVPLSMPLRLFGEVENLLNHVSRPMSLARNDPFACAARSETTTARQPRNAARPVRHARPPRADTQHAARGAIAGFLAAIKFGRACRDRYEAASHVITPVAILLAASRMLPYHRVRPDCAVVLAAGHANNWYHTSAESH